jgi:hypothetical protein
MENTTEQNSLKPTYICRRCGRKLKTEMSQQRGMGDICYSKAHSEDKHKKLFTSSLQKEK